MHQAPNLEIPLLPAEEVLTRLAVANKPGGYELPVYPFTEPAEINGQLGRHPVVIVGAGLAGLTLACDLSLRGVPAVLIDEDDSVGTAAGSCGNVSYLRKNLELFYRLGIYQRVLEKGVLCSTQRVIAHEEEVDCYNLNGSSSNESLQPALVNLPQFYVEWFLVDRIYELGMVDLRWKTKVLDVVPQDDCVRLHVETPVGQYKLECAWLVDCSGAQSVLPQRLAVPLLPFANGDELSAVSIGVAEVEIEKSLPLDCTSWITAPFNEERPARQLPVSPNRWRMEYQLPAQANLSLLCEPSAMQQRLTQQLGSETNYQLLWSGRYVLHSRCLQTLKKGRVLFAGDAAHTGCVMGVGDANAAIDDAQNLAWKIALVLQGRAPDKLLDTYSVERVASKQSNFFKTQQQLQLILTAPVSYQAAKEQASAAQASKTAEAGDVLPNLALTLPNNKSSDLVSVISGCDSALVALLAGDVDAAVFQGLEERYPLRCFQVRLQQQGAFTTRCLIDHQAQFVPRILQTQAAAIVLLRPDLYIAARLIDIKPAALEAAVRCALAIDGTTVEK